MPVEIEITNQSVREAVEAALWHREYRHACADDRRSDLDTSALSDAVGQAWTDAPCMSGTSRRPRRRCGGRCGG